MQVESKIISKREKNSAEKGQKWYLETVNVQQKNDNK